jgi:predicted kinase
MIVVMAGLPGTGKSTLSQALAERCGGIVLDKDILRSTLFPPPYVEYSSRQDDFCQTLMLQTAAYLLERYADLRIFLDGRTFARHYQRELVIEAAERLGTGWRLIECVCSEAAARERMARDATHPARNRNYELYRRLKTEFEPIPDPKLVIDTDVEPALCVAAAYAYLMA